MLERGADSFNPEPNPGSTGKRVADGQVLLVEDEDSLADLLLHLLGRSKIRAIRAADGASALRLFGEQRGSIILAFVDCRLPDIDGGDLCQELRRIAPGLPLLLTSGRDQRALLSALSAGGPTSFLQKPYMPADVVHHVNALLSPVR